jgi:hypothetical protein
MTLKQAKKIARTTALMMILRDELEDHQINRFLPKRLNSNTNTWLKTSNEFLNQILEGADMETNEQIMEIYKAMDEKFNEIIIE